MKEIFNLLNPWWRGEYFDTGISRPKYFNKLVNSLKNKRAVFLVGSRRVGKTTLLYQLIAKLLENVDRRHIFYALMDHPQVSQFTILELLKEYRQQFALDRNTLIYLFFDEIQYIKNWEQEIKAILDTEKVKIFLSGSASSQLLLKGSYLTGRLEKIEVHPLDFIEFLIFREVKISATEEYKYGKFLEEYLKIGGYPEYVLLKNLSYFSDLINNILYKDIVSLYQVRNPELLKDLFLLLADRTGHHTTYTKLASILSLKNDTVKEYIYYLKNTFLLNELPRFSTSRGQRIYGPKKFYISDNGILFHLLGRLSLGCAFEQTVFNYLNLQSRRIGFYYKDKKEADFVIDGENKEIWEAKYRISANFEQDLKIYLKICKAEKIKKIVFVTMKKQEKLVKENLNIEYIPLWKVLIRDA